VATRVREAREEWQRLDAAEHAGGETGGLSQRFHAVCQRALRPTQAYFAKRKELLRTHAQQIDELLVRAAAISDDSTDWKEQAELRGQASSALRMLDGVEARLRSGFAKQLKEAIARLGTLVGAHERDVEAAKAQLIAQATALVSGDNTALAREARELQKRWTTLGYGRRVTDQKQWREFRSACDAVFARLDGARQEKAEAAAQASAQARQLIDELAALSAAADGANEIKRRLRELDARWRNMHVDDRQLAKRQRDLYDAVAARIQQAERLQRLARFSAAMAKHAALRHAQTAPADWENLASAEDFDALLEQRHTALLSGTIGSATDEGAAREMLVRLELLAGVDSPAEDRQLRMNYQVQRLSSRLREGSGQTPERELSDLLLMWFADVPHTADFEERFARAAQAAIDSLP
jgi:hypothetical protein